MQIRCHVFRMKNKIFDDIEKKLTFIILPAVNAAETKMVRERRKCLDTMTEC